MQREAYSRNASALAWGFANSTGNDRRLSRTAVLSSPSPHAPAPASAAPPGASESASTPAALAAAAVVVAAVVAVAAGAAGAQRSGHDPRVSRKAAWRSQHKMRATWAPEMSTGSGRSRGVAWRGAPRMAEDERKAAGQASRHSFGTRGGTLHERRARGPLTLPPPAARWGEGRRGREVGGLGGGCTRTCQRARVRSSRPVPLPATTLTLVAHHSMERPGPALLALSYALLRTLPAL